jgi:hypothetical protein
MKRQLLPRFFPSTSGILASAYLITTCGITFAWVPQKTYITQPAVFNSSMIVHRINQKNLKDISKIQANNSSELTYTDGFFDSLWVAADGSGAHATLRFKDKHNKDMGMKVDAKPRNGLTKYRMPCKVLLENFGESLITWEDGKGRGCERGIHVSSNNQNRAQQTSSQYGFLVQDNKNILKSEFNTVHWQAKTFFLMAQADVDDIRYYCSALPTSGGGSAGISAGPNSIEEACTQASKTCLVKNRGSDCSFATMGEWSATDPELMVSVTCADGKSSSKLVRGSEVGAPEADSNELILSLLSELGSFGEVLGKLLGIEPKACFLDVYYPDEVIISPVDSRETIVQTADIGSSKVQVYVQKGEARLRSTQQPNGIIASENQTYIFNGTDGSSSIIRDENNSGSEPRPDTTSPTPTQETPSQPSSPTPTQETPSQPSSPR